MSEFETFFSPTGISLFGKVFKSISYEPESMDHSRDGSGEFDDNYNPPGANEALPIPPRRIERVLRRGEHVNSAGVVKPNAGDPKQKKCFARIYSFSYEGHYYRLPRPLLFLVSCTGELVRDDASDRKATISLNQMNPPAAAAGPGAAPAPQRFTGTLDGVGDAPLTSTGLTGVEARDWRFSNDVKVWRVDRKDLAICLDVEIGNYQEILLDSMINADSAASRGGSARGDAIPRGAGSFRGDMIGPHQNKL